MRRDTIVRLFGALAGFTLALSAIEAARAATVYDWLQFNGDPQHSGNDTRETTLSSGNVASLKRVFQVALPAVVDGAPAVLTGVATASGVHDLLFLTTKNGTLLALDAHTGATVWSAAHGPGTCTINNGSNACFTTSSPAVDPGRGYVYTYGLEGSVHKHAVSTGTEVTTGGWPEPTTLKPYNEKASSALSIATASGGTSYLYVTHGGYPGDNGDYQGHVTAINLADGAQTVFNAACSDQVVHFVETPGTPDCASLRSAIWARGGVVYDAALNEIFMATGNGDYLPSSKDWGDSIMALTPSGVGSGGQPLDTYTPGTFQTLENTDADLGSTAPAILPVPASSNVQHLAVQSGKDGQLRLVNLGNLSSQGGPGHTDGNVGATIAVPQGGQVVSAIAVWVNPADGGTWAFVGNGGGIAGLKLAIDGSGNPSLTVVWKKTIAGSSPLVANNVLYFASSSQIQALDPTTGNSLWQDTTIGTIHWQSPVVANGVLYIADQSAQLTAFAAPGTPVPATPAGILAIAALALVGAGLVATRRTALGAPAT